MGFTWIRKSWGLHGEVKVGGFLGEGIVRDFMKKEKLVVPLRMKSWGFHGEGKVGVSMKNKMLGFP